MKEFFLFPFVSKRTILKESELAFFDVIKSPLKTDCWVDIFHYSSLTSFVGVNSSMWINGLRKVSKSWKGPFL
jgi:hypothetical protein